MTQFSSSNKANRQTERAHRQDSGAGTGGIAIDPPSYGIEFADRAAAAQGDEIRLAPGQEKHLPHEAWHVVQQRQGRVKPTLRSKGATPAPANFPTIQRVKFKDAPGVFATLVKIHEEKEAFHKLDDEYADVEEEEAGPAIKSKLVEMWNSRNQGKPYPGEMAAYEFGESLKAAEKPILDDLLVITDLDAPLSGDSVHLEFEDFDKLRDRLTKAGFTPDAEGFMGYVGKRLEHFRFIRKQLADEPEVLGKVWSGEPKALRISFSPLGADEHGFAPPTKLDLAEGAEQKSDELKPAGQKSLVHKARPGAVDKLVIDLFKDINKTLKQGFKLPEYAQALFKNDHLLSEFITGGTLASRKGKAAIGMGTGAGQNVAKLAKTPEERAELKNNIEILEAVAKRIGLTDLHEDNVIYDPGKNQIVPIDLEAFSAGMPKETGLYGLDDEGPKVGGLLPAEADPFIEKFKAQLDTVERRLVPVATGTLISTLGQDKGGVEATVGLIQNSLEKDKFIVDGDALKSYVQAAKNHKPMAVPLFTVQRGQVLASPIGAGKKTLVARRNAEIKTDATEANKTATDPIVNKDSGTV